MNHSQPAEIGIDPSQFILPREGGFGFDDLRRHPCLLVLRQL